MGDQDRKAEIIDKYRAGEDDEDDVASGYGKSHPEHQTRQKQEHQC